MSSHTATIITGTGCCIPTERIPNSYFLDHEFYDQDGKKFERSTKEIIDKFQAITGIDERRYVSDDLNTSDIAYEASKDALESSNTDKESLDYIVVAHNFGDVQANNRRSDLVPSLAARIKHQLHIRNPQTVCYDLPFGCPGWLQGLIQTDYFIRSGDAKRALVVGAEILSRVSDPHDRDTMIYADGAGACVVEGVKSETPVGVLSHSARSDTYEHAHMLQMGKSYNPDFDGDDLFLKMQGHKLYEYALRKVPVVVRESIVKAGLTITDISKVFIHQANAKMDDAILRRLFKLFGDDPPPEWVMPMTISWLGNSSVATLPTLVDLIFKRKLDNHRLESGDIIAFASVGAGMNINSLIYKMP
jgi:3-oxoacyl-[acyl-carrier-protein] synthase-3